MTPWLQDPTPLGSLWMSVIVAVIPMVFFLLALAVFRVRGYVAALSTLVISLGIAIVVYHMPVASAAATAIYGALYGLWPIVWIIIAAVFLYQLSVKSGQFDIARQSIQSITPDPRLQVLLIAFSFGAFLEGAAGFGAPVAITAALLVGLGFPPVQAAVLCLIANMAPATYGALGIEIAVGAQVSGLDAFDIGANTGRQFIFFSLLMPFWLVAVMDGWKGIRETWDSCLVSGISFTATMFLVSNFIGPELPDIVAALVSLIALALYLRLKGAASRAKQHEQAQGTTSNDLSAGKMLNAWAPFIVLTLMVSIWTTSSFKALFSGDGPLSGLVWNIPVPWVDHMILAESSGHREAMSAVFKFDPINSTGTAIFLAALITIVLHRISLALAWKTFRETMHELRWTIVTISAVLSFAFVTNYSGGSTTLALALVATGAAFPFFSPVLGWLGVFLTGSVTSSNALFSSLQANTASQLHLSQNLMVAANGTGGMAAKMISPQNIAVAAAATGMAGKESDLMRKTLLHSVVLLILVGLVTAGFAYLVPEWVIGK